jgi:hypothetical protein
LTSASRPGPWQVAQPSGGVLGVLLLASFTAVTEPPAEAEIMWLRAAWLV